MKISPVVTPVSPYYRNTRQAAVQTSTPKAYEVNISPEGKSLQAQNNSLSNTAPSLMASLDSFMDGAGKDGKITVDEIKAFSEKQQSKAENLLKQALEELGIPENSTIEVGQDEEGQIKVSSNLSAEDNRRLEAALNDSTEFRNSFKAASASKGLLDAIEKHLAFSKAYEKDPKAAVAQYNIGSTGFKEKGRYILSFNQGEMEMVCKKTSMPG